MKTLFKRKMEDTDIYDTKNIQWFFDLCDHHFCWQCNKLFVSGKLNQIVKEKKEEAKSKNNAETMKKGVSKQFHKTLL